MSNRSNPYGEHGVFSETTVHRRKCERAAPGRSRRKRWIREKTARTSVQFFRGDQKMPPLREMRPRIYWPARKNQAGLFDRPGAGSQLA
ncbi:MAG TPA: hypothetical protein DEB39_07875 [Planctomycetaceae bacterium]|nr:hypothetical protein [Planctomycetaceae bacterium]